MLFYTFVEVIYMARTIKFSKEEILEKSIDFIKEYGYSKLTVRELANYIGCSTQPIFKNYATFDENSVLLIRLGNDSIVKLPIYIENDRIAVFKDYGVFENVPYYQTITIFMVDDDVVKKIVEHGELIKKIRVSFTNGDFQDWDIDISYQQKLTKGLMNSYQQVVLENAIRKEKMDNK